MSTRYCRKLARGAMVGTALAVLTGAGLTAASAQSTATVKNLVYQFQDTKITIPELTVIGTDLTDADLAALAAPDHPAPVQDWLKKLDHGTVVIPEADIDSASAATDPGQAHGQGKFIVKDIKAENIDQGVVGAISVSGATVNGQDSKNQSITGTFGAIGARTVNVAAYLRVLTEARTNPDEPLTTLIESFSSSGFKIDALPEGSFSNGSIDVGTIKARPPLMPYPELLKTLSEQLKISNPTPEQLSATFKNLADLIEGVEIGHIDIRDLSFSGLDKGQPIAMKVGHFGFGPFANARINEYVYENLDLSEVGKGGFKIGAFGLRGFDGKAALDALKQFAAATPDEQKNFNIRKFIPTIDQFVMAGIDMDMVSNDHKGNLDHGDRIKMSLDRFEVNGSRYILGVPTALTMALDRLIIPLPTDGSQPDFQSLVDFGYDRLEWSAKFDAAWDEATQILKLNELSASGPDIGSYKVTMRVENVARDLFQGDTTDMTVAALAAAIKAADLKIVNDGLLERLLAKTADDSHQSEAAVRKEWTSAVHSELPSLIGAHKNMQEILAAIDAFIAHPKNLYFSATSDSGLGVADLYNIKEPADILDKVDLRATANE